MPLQMASQALSAGQVAEQGRVLWHGVTTETPRQLPEKRRGGCRLGRDIVSHFPPR